jgi:hypothetical protein
MSEYKEFWLTTPRYMCQHGEFDSQYISASAQAPVKVRLPADFVVSKYDQFLWEVKPAKPKPHHAEVAEHKTPGAHEGVMKLPEVAEAVEARADKPGRSGKKRAADL